MTNIKIVSIKMVKTGELRFAKKITSPHDFAELLTEFIGDKDREVFVVATLNTKNDITSVTECSTGTLNSSLVHPREVFKTAILGNAASIIVGHNHPSGDSKPSDEDIKTRFLPSNNEMRPQLDINIPQICSKIFSGE